MKTIQYFVTAFFLFTITSCELVREDYTEIYPENFFQTEKDLELAVNALYTTFSPAYTNENIGLYGPGNKGYQIFSEMTTDALWCTWGWEWDELHFQQWYATIGGNMAGIIWDAYAKYNFLSKARNTIRRIERSSVSEEVKKKYMAEAKALTGWMVWSCMTCLALYRSPLTRCWTTRKHLFIFHACLRRSMTFLWSAI